MAFQQLKEYLSRPPIMSNLEANEVLYTYIAVAHHAVSLVLIRDDNGLQKPVYYVSKSLHKAEVRYLPLEKAILAVVHAMRKLLHCSNSVAFEIHASDCRLHWKNQTPFWELSTSSTCHGPP